LPYLASDTLLFKKRIQKSGISQKRNPRSMFKQVVDNASAPMRSGERHCRKK
jgi:hypothetical protein